MTLFAKCGLGCMLIGALASVSMAQSVEEPGSGLEASVLGSGGGIEGAILAVDEAITIEVGSELEPAAEGGQEAVDALTQQAVTLDAPAPAEPEAVVDAPAPAEPEAAVVEPAPAEPVAETDPPSEPGVDVADVVEPSIPMESSQPDAIAEADAVPEPVQAPQSDRVGQALFTSAVVDREPADRLSQVPADLGRLVFFTVLEGLQGTRVIHRWHGVNERPDFEIGFNIGGSTWRVWSERTIRPGDMGPWQVDILVDGQLLETHAVGR